MRIFKKDPWTVNRSVISVDIPFYMAEQILSALAITRADQAEEKVRQASLDRRSPEARSILHQVGALSVGLQQHDDCVSFLTLSQRDRDEVWSALDGFEPQAADIAHDGAVYVNLPRQVVECAFAPLSAFAGLSIQRTAELIQYATRARNDQGSEQPLNQEESVLVWLSDSSSVHQHGYELMQALHSSAQVNHVERRMLLLATYPASESGFAEGWKALR